MELSNSTGLDSFKNRLLELDAPPIKLDASDEDLRRFFANFYEDPSGCWVWTSWERSFGYGGFFWRGKMYTAHRFSYLLFNGTLPRRGRHVHHICEVRRCVNPAHLVPLSARIHTIEYTPRSITYINHHKTHCIRGHELSGDNLYIDAENGKRRCRECRALWVRDKRSAEPPRPERTHCKYGHPWIPENIVTNGVTGFKRCRICLEDYAKEYRKNYTGESVKHRKTHCVHGHELTPDNVYERNGARNCLTCHREATNRRREQMRQQKQQIEQ